MLLRPILVVLAATLLTSNATDSSNPASRLHAALGGHWTGTLRYRDYQDSTRFVTLPTVLSATVAADSMSVLLDFTYDDGPGKTVHERDRLDLDAAGRTLRWGSDTATTRSQYDVTDRTNLDRGTPIVLVLERNGSDDNRPARFRETLSVSDTELRIRKEVLFTGATALLFRHEYVFQRDAGPPRP